jgi:hypothetical protein
MFIVDNLLNGVQTIIFSIQPCIFALLGAKKTRPKEGRIFGDFY